MSRIETKLKEIYDDLSTNVTHIYERQNVHFAIDLVYHSPLRILFEGQIKKGYPECLIVGDTKCGKTETAEKLLQHYRVGAISTGETSNFPGLIASLQQVQNRWQIIWGKIPFNNRRLLIIDEVSGLSTGDIEKMSTIRSSGYADISKVKSAKVEARTRLVWIANPRQGFSIDHFASGITVVRDLIGKPEDISRFDFVIVVSAQDVDADMINDPGTQDTPHVYDSDSCRNLIMWAWTRDVKHIKIHRKTTDACRHYAKLMYHKYSDAFPLVNAGEQKLKLARLATALACRLFNTSTGEDVIVEPEHVEYIYYFLNYEYSRPSFNYDTWSSNKSTVSIIKDDDRAVVMDRLAEMGATVVMQLLETRQLSVKGIADATANDDAQARIIVHEWIKAGALTPYHTYYFKTPGLIKLMKEFLNAPTTLAEREY